jgi:hypothetical protein
MSNVQISVVDLELFISDRTLEKFGFGSGSGSRPFLALLMSEAALFPKSCHIYHENFILYL